MKTIAVEEATYAKLSKLKAQINKERGLHLKFSELFDETIRRPLGLHLLEDELRKALNSVARNLSKDESVLGIILFGSVAKLNFNANSDIDIFAIVEESSAKTFDYVEKTILNLEMEYFELLIERKLPLHFSPFICSQDSLKRVNPIFFDIADYGIILYDKGGVVSEFVDKYISMQHRRQYTEYGEILTWQI